MTMQIIYLIFGAAFLGLAVKQMSYILIYGSIFESLRQGIDARAKSGRWFFVKMRELFTCPLCMTTQVALWTVGVPFGILATWQGWNKKWFSPLVWYTEAPLVLLEGFLLAMAFGALGLWIWDIVNYRPEKYRAQMRYYEELLVRQAAGMRQALITGYKPGERSLSQLTPTIDDIRKMIERLSSCDGIGCPASREACRIHTGRVVFDMWWHEYHDGEPVVFHEIMKDAISHAFREFYRGRRNRDISTADLHLEVAGVLRNRLMAEEEKARQ